MASSSPWVRRSSEDASRMKTLSSGTFKAQDSSLNSFHKRSSSRVYPLPEPVLPGSGSPNPSEEAPDGKSKESPSRRATSSSEELQQKPVNPSTRLTFPSSLDKGGVQRRSSAEDVTLDRRPSSAVLAPANTDWSASFNLQSSMRGVSGYNNGIRGGLLPEEGHSQVTSFASQHKRGPEDDDSFGSGLRSLLRIMSLYIRPATSAASGSSSTPVSAVSASSQPHSLLTGATPARFYPMGITSGQPGTLSLAPLQSPANSPAAPPSLVLGSAGGLGVLNLPARNLTIRPGVSLPSSENEPPMVAAVLAPSPPSAAAATDTSLPLGPLPPSRASEQNIQGSTATPGKAGLAWGQGGGGGKTGKDRVGSAGGAALPPRPPQKGLGSSFWYSDIQSALDEEIERPLLPPLTHAPWDTMQPEVRGGKKTLVLDLDETLVHSMFAPPERHTPDYVIDVAMEGRSTPVYVLKRPGVHEFLQAMAELYEVVVFTASMSRYASPLLDKLDPTGKLIHHRLYREACSPVSAHVHVPGGVVQQHGGYVKDLARLGRELSHTILVDNSPHSFAWQPANGLLVPNFIDDMNDDVLFKLIPFLIGMASAAGDVRFMLKRSWTAASEGGGGPEVPPGAGVRRDSGTGQKRRANVGGRAGTGSGRM